MKLQKRLSRKYKGKSYFKYIVIISEKDIQSAKLTEGDNLSVKSSNGRIILKKENI